MGVWAKSSSRWSGGGGIGSASGLASGSGSDCGAGCDAVSASLRLSAGDGGATGGSTGGAAGLSSSSGPSWNQLWRHLAQRTVRPSTPIALSGTTYLVAQAGQEMIIIALLSMMGTHPTRCAGTIQRGYTLFSTWIGRYRPICRPILAPGTFGLTQRI